VVAQAVEGILAAAQSGIKTVRKQRLEAALLQIIPVLNDALSVKDVPELIIGSCMIVTIMATRVPLGDTVLNGLMEAVALNWSQPTIDARLVCLAVIAQEREARKLPKTVTKKILAMEDLMERLTVISGSYRVDKLLFGLVLRCLERLQKSGGQRELSVVENGFKSGLLSEVQTSSVIKSLLPAMTERMSGNESNARDSVSLREGFARIVSSLANSPAVTALEKIVRRNHMDMGTLELALQTVLRREPEEMLVDNIVDVPQAPADRDARNLETAISSLSGIPALEISFVGVSDPDIFGKLGAAFVLAVSSETELPRFLALRSLRKAESLAGDATFITFFVRIWCGYYPQLVRCRALRIVAEHVSGCGDVGLDFHLLIPYLIFALSDRSSQVRRAAAECLVVIEKNFNPASPPTTTWAKDNFYPSASAEAKSVLVSQYDGHLHSLLSPDLQECILDGAVVSNVLNISLGGHSSKKEKQLKVSSLHLKSSKRSAILELFAQHAALTEILPVKCQILGILNEMEKATSMARSKILLPALQNWLSLATDQVQAACNIQRTSLAEVNVSLLRCLTPREHDGIDLLSQLLTGANSFGRTDIVKPAYNRLSETWSSIPVTTRANLLRDLLDTALCSSTDAIKKRCRDEAMGSLRTLSLSSEDLVSLIEILPASIHMPQGPAAKRRRTSRSEMVKFELSPRETVETLHRYTLVLEIIESSSPGEHPDLLKGLFHILGELQNFSAQTDSSLNYLRSLTINSLLAVVDRLKV
jgi:U3 small nucleolar RNA-associated protein 10